MIYQFRNEQTGEIEERYYPMADAPEIGSIVEGNLLRIASRTQPLIPPNVHFVAHQLSQGYKYARKFDDWGTPVFDSKKELDECLARANDNGENLAWNK